MTVVIAFTAIAFVGLVWAVAVNVGYSHGYRDAIRHRAEYDEAIFLERFGDDIEAARAGKN